MIKALGHDVTCDLCGTVIHCPEKESWPHRTVYISDSPKYQRLEDMFTIDLCKECWPNKVYVLKKSIAKKFLEFIGCAP